MFKIIDRTLTAIRLEKDHPTGKMLSDMCQFLSRLGVDIIEVSMPILNRIGKLPEGPKYILKLGTPEEMGKYPGFEKYVWKSKDPLQIDKVIHEIQVNDVREIPMLSRYSHLSNVRVTGLDELMCADYRLVMNKIKEIFGASVEFFPQNSYYCATALAVEWLQNGGKNVGVSFAGVGGYAVLEEVVVAAKVILHKKINVDLSILPEVTALYEKIIRHKVSYNKAVLGNNIFVVEAGIHADAINKNPITYEPYDPQTVGKKRRIVVGKHSGISAIKIKLSELGAQLPEHLLEIILENVKEESIAKRRSLTDGEFIHIVKGVMANERQKIYC